MANDNLEDVIRMVEDGVPCMEIVTRITAVQSELKKANQEILKGYLSLTVTSLMQEGDRDNSIPEMIDIMGRILN